MDSSSTDEDLKEWTTVRSPQKGTPAVLGTAEAGEAGQCHRDESARPGSRPAAGPSPSAAAPSSAAARLQARLSSRSKGASAVQARPVGSTPAAGSAPRVAVADTAPPAVPAAPLQGKSENAVPAGPPLAQPKAASLAQVPPPSQRGQPTSVKPSAAGSTPAPVGTRLRPTGAKSPVTLPPQRQSREAGESAGAAAQVAKAPPARHGAKAALPPGPEAAAGPRQSSAAAEVGHSAAVERRIQPAGTAAPDTQTAAAPEHDESDRAEGRTAGAGPAQKPVKQQAGPAAGGAGRAAAQEPEIQPVGTEGERGPEAGAARAPSWSWGSFLPAAMQGAVRDVQQLTTSFQQALLDAAGGEEDEPHAEAGEAAAGQRPESGPPSPDTRAQRAAVLARLQGRDTPVEASLKVIETGVTGLVGSLWTGARGAAVAAAREARELAAALELESAGRRAGSLLDRGIETFGETAISLLDGRFDARARGAPHVHAAPAPGADFQACFLHYGGRQVLEELEALGSECGRMVTRLRARLEPEAQAALDRAAAALSPAFDLQGDGPARGPSQPGEDLLPVARGHAIIASVCSDGVERAAAMASSATGAVGEVLVEGRRRLAELAAVAIERLLALGRSLGAQFKTGRPANDSIRWPAAPEAKAALLRGQALRMLAAMEALGSAFAAAASARAQHAVCGAVAGVAGSQGAPSGDGAAASAPLAAGSSSDGAAQLDELHADVQAATAHLGDALRGLLYIVLLASQDRSMVYSQA